MSTGAWVHRDVPSRAKGLYQESHTCNLSVVCKTDHKVFVLLGFMDHSIQSNMIQLPLLIDIFQNLNSRNNRMVICCKDNL